MSNTHVIYLQIISGTYIYYRHITVFPPNPLKLFTAQVRPLVSSSHEFYNFRFAGITTYAENSAAVSDITVFHSPTNQKILTDYRLPFVVNYLGFSNDGNYIFFNTRSGSYIVGKIVNTADVYSIEWSN